MHCALLVIKTAVSIYVFCFGNNSCIILVNVAFYNFLKLKYLRQTLTLHTPLCIMLHNNKRGDHEMATNLLIDVDLLNDALKVGGLKTKRETVNQALREFVKRRKTADVLSLFGTIDYDSDYNYKDLRKRIQ